MYIDIFEFASRHLEEEIEKDEKEIIEEKIDFLNRYPDRIFSDRRSEENDIFSYDDIE